MNEKMIVSIVLIAFIIGATIWLRHKNKRRG